MSAFTAIAHSNIALIKYWGKRDEVLNLPAVGSISMALSALFTTTTVEFREELTGDELVLNGKNAPEKQLRRTTAFLDLFRTLAGNSTFARIVSENNFPTGAGLASSASGFAALTLAACAAANLDPTFTQMSEYARMGSGSAARSIFGGFVEMRHGRRADGMDAVAEPMYPQDYWPLEMLICVTEEGEKEIGSTAGMNLTRDTSAYYSAWIRTGEADLAAMREALSKKDFQLVGELAEYSCLKMHALAMSANPGILYWNGTSVEIMQAIRKLRKAGHPVYFTIDAGPQIKLLCPPGGSAAILEKIRDFPGIRQIIVTGVGPGAYLTRAGAGL
ncbi:MAG: diphosphomevalonate decarboxylase [Calditrichaeota bacterium]|nr:diphosphomevalonate decarboxylase [Calditrichota bacterium]